MPRRLAAALTIIALAWSALLLLTPVALARGVAPVAAAALVYDAAGRICHQRPERSFRLEGIQLPVCARCFGLYAAGVAGALLGWTASARRRRPSRDRLLLLAAAFPTAITFSLEFIGLAAFSNISRFVAALPLGLAAGSVFIGALRAEGSPLPATHVQLPGPL